MNVIGETMTVLSSTDPTKTGMKGKVVLDTANTLLIDAGNRMLRIEKSGSAFLIHSTGQVVTGSDISGRLEDRLGRRRN